MGGIISCFPGGGSAPSSGNMPVYTFTGSHELIDEGLGNWRIKFYSSGLLTLRKTTSVDIFAVGGGGGGGYGSSTSFVNGGGGGGYTATKSTVQINAGVEYSVVVGAGGAAGTKTYHPGQNGGDTSLTSDSLIYIEAAGGKGCPSSDWPGVGGDGGSGGGGDHRIVTGRRGNGGSDGADGWTEEGSTENQGTGQGTTTREFGAAAGTLYSGGGGCAGAIHEGYYKFAGKGGEGGGGNGACYGVDTITTLNAENGAENTGGGGGGGTFYNSGERRPGAGGSGILIIRKARPSA